MSTATSPQVADERHPTDAGSGLNIELLLPTVILIGGLLNGFVVRIMEAVRTTGGETLLFGISPFELIAALVGAHLIVTHDAPQESDTYRPGWAEVIALGFFVVPSSAMAWIGVTLYAGYLGLRLGGPARIGALLFCALGIAALWGSIFINWFAAPITTVEAHIVAGLAKIAIPEITVSANLMGIVGGHQVLLLPACASLYLIPKALVAFVALSVFMGTQSPIKGLLRLGVITVCCLALANWLRLAIMTWSNELYQLAHGPIGANIFDLTQTAILIAAAMWASR